MAANEPLYEGWLYAMRTISNNFLLMNELEKRLELKKILFQLIRLK